MTPDLTTLTFTRDERAQIAHALTVCAAMVDALGRPEQQRSLLALWERVQPDGPTGEVDKWIA